MSYTTTAENIIDAVIQDGQVQTTNRTTLLNYVNRVSLRILRESQWIFLRSKQQLFMTNPDAAQYWLGSGSPPAGCVATGLNLSDIYGILPDSVYDITNGRRLTQDSESVLVGYGLRYKDAEFRSALPRTYAYDFNIPGILNLYPPPDNNNLYQPIPTSPVCNWTAGGMIATSRNYNVYVTLVDSNGGESLPCAQFTNVTVPSGNLLTVDSPTLEVSSASTVAYAYYNIYVAVGPYGNFGTAYLQNSSPVPANTLWTEPPAGIGVHTAPPMSINVPDSFGSIYTLGVLPSGLLVATRQAYTGVTFPTYLKDSSMNTWLVTISSIGQAQTTSQYNAVAPQLILADTTGQNWIVGVNTGGHLTTTATGPLAPSIVPAPVTSTIVPMYGYVVGFHYQKQRTPITTTTQILQIPDQYSDVVVAGVNYFANLYTAKADDLNIKVAVWKKEFMDGLAQMRRDLRINFRNTDVIMPDPATQYQIGTQSGYSFYAV